VSQKVWPLLLVITVGVVGLVLLGVDFGSGKQDQDKDKEEYKPLTRLETIDEKVGDGETAEPGDRVTVHYTGTLRKGGKQFDSSVGKKPFAFTLGAGEVIQGWDQGVAGMKVGGKRKLLIPAYLGYGTRGAGDDIPPNADLVFEVELLKVDKGSKE
jgi:FKBP-type peptidyl-prolyl cis-trans isomerase